MSDFTLSSLIEARDTFLTGDETPEEIRALEPAGRERWIKYVLKRTLSHPHNRQLVSEWNLDAGKERFTGPKAPGYYRVMRVISNIMSRMPTLEPMSYNAEGLPYYWTSSYAPDDAQELRERIRSRISSLGYEEVVLPVPKMPKGLTPVQQHAYRARAANAGGSYTFMYDIGTLLLPVLTLSRGNDETPIITAHDVSKSPTLIRVLSTEPGDTVGYLGTVSALRPDAKDTPRVDELEEYSVGVTFTVYFASQVDGTLTVSITTGHSLIALGSIGNRIPANF